METADFHSLVSNQSTLPRSPEVQHWGGGWGRGSQRGSPGVCTPTVNRGQVVSESTSVESRSVQQSEKSSQKCVMFRGTENLKDP